MASEWLVLIYTVPSQPTRKRAYVWRELKRLGSVYLRDGVAVLPRRPDLEQGLGVVAARIREYEGTAYLLLAPEFSEATDATFVTRFQEDRREEYREMHHAGVRFLRDVLEDVDADDFGFPDVDKLESELARLHRWFEQIGERDYFPGAGTEPAQSILEKCDRAFEHFVHTASGRAERVQTQPEDAFERLGGPAASGREEYPL
ncbi:MAG: Chromate resistance protein ChrB [Chloroflexota bacterium]